VSVEESVPPATPPQARRFAAFRHRDSAVYITTAGLSMMGDNIEHVITYWVLWETFHSPLLSGFQVVSHWLPFLLLSIPFGRLAERYDCRRIIQISQLLFVAVSVGWGVLFLTGTLQAWQACVLLVLHGIAGALWGPAEQVMLHDLVETHELPSAVRMNATLRSLGVLAGPAVGAALLFGLGPATGILVNVVFYLPMTVFLFTTRWTGHVRDGKQAPERAGFRDTLRVLAEVRGDRQIVVVLLVSALGALFVGGPLLQVAMPEFAARYPDPSAAYGILLFANGIGGVVGGLLLEATRWLEPTARSAVLSTLAYGVCVLVFSVSGWLPLAILALVVGGIANMASLSSAQTVMQLRAPVHARGRVLGLSSMVANGFRTGSGVIVAGLGAIAGVTGAVVVSAVLLVVGAAILAVASRRTLSEKPV
jgi:MFS family permease